MLSYIPILAFTYSSKSLVSNQGFDGSGVHCGNDEKYSITIRESCNKFESETDLIVD